MTSDSIGNLMKVFSHRPLQERRAMSVCPRCPVLSYIDTAQCPTHTIQRSQDKTDRGPFLNTGQGILPRCMIQMPGSIILLLRQLHLLRSRYSPKVAPPIPRRAGKASSVRTILGIDITFLKRTRSRSVAASAGDADPKGVRSRTRTPPAGQQTGRSPPWGLNPSLSPANDT